jgi:iron complex outermembrane receptor protein
MVGKVRSRLFISVAVFVGASATPAIAQSQDTGSTAEIEEIVVTANRREQRLQDVPISITAETGDDLRRRGAQSLNDIITNTPGITNTGLGEGVAGNISIRGVNSDGVANAQNAASVLVDDINPDPGTLTLFSTNLKIVDVARVEVLRGPQGTLFGSGSLSGTVRFVSNKPDLSRFGGSIDLTGSNTRYGASSYSGEVVLNAPIVTDKVGVRVVGYRDDTGGWIDNPSFAAKNVNREIVQGVRAMLSIAPADDLDITATVIAQRAIQQGQASSFFDPAPGNANRIYEQPTFEYPSRTRLAAQIYSLTARYSPSWGTITATSTYMHRNGDELFNGAESSISLAEALNAGGLGLTDPVPLLGRATRYTKTNTHTQELRYDLPTDLPIRWTIGAYHSRITGGGAQTFFTAGDQLKSIVGDQLVRIAAESSTQSELAVFTDATYTFADRFDLTAGVRQSRFKIGFDSTASGILALLSNGGDAGGILFDILSTGIDPNVYFGAPERQITLSRTEKNNSTTPRFAFTFRQSRDMSLYVSAARGFRTGGPNIVAPLSRQVPLSYGPDSLWSYEIGAKARLLNGRLQVSAAAYRIDWSNIQSALNTTDAAEQGYIANAGSARLKGFELEATALPLSWLQLGGSLTVSSGKFTKDLTALGVDVRDGDRMQGTPRFQSAAYAGVAFDLIKPNDTSIRISHRYRGASYALRGSQGPKSGDYHIVDIRGMIELGRFELSLFVDNVFDSSGSTQALPGTPATPARAYRERPRTVGIGIRAQI